MDATATLDPLLSIENAAHFLGVNAMTVRRMIDRREITALQLGGQPGRPLRIPVSALNAVLHGWETRR